MFTKKDKIYKQNSLQDYAWHEIRMNNTAENLFPNKAKR